MPTKLQNNLNSNNLELFEEFPNNKDTHMQNIKTARTSAQTSVDESNVPNEDHNNDYPEHNEKPEVMPKPKLNAKTTLDSAYQLEDFAPFYSYESEMGLIGCILLGANEVMPYLIDSGFNSEAFADSRHRIIYSTCRKMHSGGKPIDDFSIITELRGNVSSAYLTECMNSTPSAANYTYYLSTIQNRFQGRTLNRVMKSTWEGILEDPDSLSKQAEYLKNQILALPLLLNGDNRAFEIMLPSQLAEYNPPTDSCLVGDNHIVCGALTVIAGHGGVGKSRVALWLAVCGALKQDWMGLPVHRHFKTYILQAENGKRRLSEELKTIMEKYPDCNFDDWIRISPPPENGLAINDPAFQKTVKMDIKSFKPDVFVIDPWTELVQDGTQRDYAIAYNLLRSIIPSSEEGPALLVIAHTRKPGNSGRKARGRDLLHEIAGSFSLGSRARSAFSLEAGSSDPDQNSVVWTCCKNNDGDMDHPTAWIRGDGCFAEDTNFDWEIWNNPQGAEDSRNPNDMRAFEILEQLKNGAPVSFSEWHEACSEAGFFKGKASFSSCIERLQNSGHVTKGEGKRGTYQPILADGAYSE